jgi:hypothetical protein
MIREWVDKVIAIFSYKAGIQIRKWKDHGLSVDPNNAVWFFGCSHVFGTGLEHNETAPYQLGRLLGHNVVNYGRPGIGPLAIRTQIEELLKKYTPKAIIVAWPSFDRWQSGSVLWIPQCLTGVKMHNDNFGCKKLWPVEWEQYKDLVVNGGIRKLNLQAVQDTRKLVNNFPYIEFSYTEQEFATPVYPFKDLAKDGSHPGVNTQYEIAQWINNELRILL